MVLIHTVRALKDNYCYVVQREDSELALVIDPSEAAPIRSFLKAHHLKLGLILNTHHHHDHVGGNSELKSESGCEVYCSAHDVSRVPEASRGFSDGETFTFDGIHFEVLEIPGHTQGQIAFYIREDHALFVGDTLFAMGCGRLFEGTPEQMFASLEKIKQLDPNTQIFFGHEYTETNAKFAMMIEPENAEIDVRLSKTRDQINAQGFADAPTLADELKVNPFLRAADVATFAKRREMRNSF